VRFRTPLALTFTALFSFLARPSHAQEPLAPTPETGAPKLLPTPAQAPDLPPPASRVTHIVAGLSTTAVSYGLATGVSFLFPELRGSKDLRIPVAGPWMTLAQTGCPTNDPDCTAVPLVLGGIFMVVSGVTQLGGLAIAGEGLFLNTSSGRRPAPKRAAVATVRAVPMDFGPGSAGLGLVGSF
jgi:hypothetical protein